MFSHVNLDVPFEARLRPTSLVVLPGHVADHLRCLLGHALLRYINSRRIPLDYDHSHAGIFVQKAGQDCGLAGGVNLYETRHIHLQRHDLPNVRRLARKNYNAAATSLAAHLEAQIEAAFNSYFDYIGVPLEGTDFTGRSDYGEFILNGIPAGGLFTGAEVVKTEDQANKWGGVAGQAYDPCYHQLCDNLGNVDRTALDRNSDAIAFVLGSYAISTEDVNGVPPRATRAKTRTAQARAAAASLAGAEEDNHHGVRS